MSPSSSERPPAVACIILNWNNPGKTRDCLTGLRQWSGDGYSLSVIVVDNGSAGFSEEMMREAFPGVVIVRLPENRGFTGGCNAGAAAAAARASDYLMFLNNDTQIRSDFLAPLVRLLAREPTIGVVSPIERGIDPPSISSFGVRVDLARGTALGIPHRSEPDLSQAQFHRSDTAHGGMMLTRTSLFEELGGFDDAFFAYFEDVDLCLRARQHGYACGFYVSSEVYHWGGGSTAKNAGGSTLRDCLGYRGSILLVRKHASLRQKLAFFLLHLPVQIVRPLAGRILRGQWRQASQFVKWIARGIFQKLAESPPDAMLRALGLR